MKDLPKTKWIKIKFVLSFILLILSITTFASSTVRNQSLPTASDIEKIEAQGKSAGAFLAVLLFYIPTLLFLFPLKRKITRDICKNVKLIGFCHYRLRMFISGYIFTLLIFIFIYFVAALFSSQINIGVYHLYNYVAAVFMFIPIFFAALDIPFTTKINNEE